MPTIGSRERFARVAKTSRFPNTDIRVSAARLALRAMLEQN